MLKALKWAYEKGKTNERQRIRLLLENAQKKHWQEVEMYNRFDGKTESRKHKAELHAAVGDIISKLLQEEHTDSYIPAPIDRD